MIEENMLKFMNYLQFYFEKMPTQSINKMLTALTFQADFF